MSHTYVETAEFPGLDYYGFEPWFFACCAECEWEGPGRLSRAEAERDRRWHPRIACWLGRKSRDVREDGWGALLWR